MTCPTKTKSAEIVIDYCAGKLDPVERSHFEEHLRDCSDCRGTVHAQQDLWNALEHWTPADISPEFDAKLYARIAQEDEAPAWKRWWRRTFSPVTSVALWKPALSLATACAVVTIGLVVHTPKPSAPSSQVRGDRVDIEQVEQTLEDLDLLTPAVQTPASPM